MWIAVCYVVYRCPKCVQYGSKRWSCEVWYGVLSWYVKTFNLLRANRGVGDFRAISVSRIGRVCWVIRIIRLKRMQVTFPRVHFTAHRIAEPHNPNSSEILNHLTTHVKKTIANTNMVPFSTISYNIFDTYNKPLQPALTALKNRL